VKPPEIIETSRLILRIPRMADAEAIFSAYAQDHEVTRYLRWRPHEEREQTREFMESRITAWDNDSEYSWIITLRGSDSCVGMIALRVDESKADVGYVLAKPYWGKGIMTEAVTAIVDWAYGQPTLFRVWAVCDVENIASARVLEKCGMRREGILRRWIVHPNISAEPRDCFCYARSK